jgi:monoamine oxidase
MRIPVNHRYTRYYVHKMNLRLRLFVSSHQNLNCFYNVSQLYNRKSPIVPPRIRIHSGRTNLYWNFHLSKEQQNSLIAPQMFQRVIADVVESLTDEERADLLNPQLQADRTKELDRLSMGEFLRMRMGSSATELFGITSGIEPFFDRASTSFIREAVLAEDGPLSRIEGGMWRLPEALAHSLTKTRIHRCKVVGIAVRDGKIYIRFIRTKRIDGKEIWDKEISEQPAQMVLCTLPFSVLRQLEIMPQLSPQRMEAIRSMSYASAAKVLLYCDQRFWEIIDRIFGGASHTDSMCRATFYPSDNVNDDGHLAKINTADERRRRQIEKEQREREQRERSERNAAEQAQQEHQSKLAYSIDFGPAAQAIATGEEVLPRDEDRSSGPGVLLAAYCLGQDARRLGTLREDDRIEATIRAVSEYHPELRKHCKDGKTIFWDECPYAAGAFAMPQPGEQSSGMYSAAVSPVTEPGYSKKLFFAGEHCSLNQGWIQGAIQSALDAVERIVAI